MHVIRIAKTPDYLYLDTRSHGTDRTFRRNRETGIITRSRGNGRWAYVPTTKSAEVLKVMGEQFDPASMFLTRH